MFIVLICGLAWSALVELIHFAVAVQQRIDHADDWGATESKY